MTDEIRSGAIPLAQYLEQQLPEYQDNPLISALPPIPDLQEVLPNFRLYPASILRRHSLTGGSGPTPLPACCMVSFSL